MKKLAKFKSQSIAKNDQKNILGGRFVTTCYDLYFSDGQNRCAVPSPTGEILYGTIQNGKCCL